MKRDKRLKGRIAWVTGNKLDTTLDAITWLATSRVLGSLGWKVTLLSQGGVTWKTKEGIEIRSLSSPRVYFFGSFLFHLSLLRYIFLRRNRIDLLLFHQISAIWIFLLGFFCSLLSLKVPLLVMDTRDLNDYEGGLKNWLRVSYFKVAHLLANKFADGQTAITPKMAEMVNIPDPKLFGIWPSGVDLDRFGRAQKRRKWPGVDEPVRLIYTGKLHAERNLLPLAKAVLKANSRGMAFQFVLLGDGLEREALEDFAGGSLGGVVILRPVPHDAVPDYLQEAHIGVTPLPSSGDLKFETSCPIKMFEYMATGMPIFTTRNICHTSVVGKGGFAFWAEDGTTENLFQALIHIWNEKANLHRMGREAAREAKNWTWEAAGRKLSRALEDCLSIGIGESVILDPKKSELG